MIYGMPFLGISGMNPDLALYQQLQGMPMPRGLSPNQMLALQASRGGYGPNSPYLAAAQALQGQMMGPGVGGAAMMPAQGLRDFVSSGGADVLRRAYGGYGGSPQPMNPSIGLSDLVRQWQQGQMNPIAARQGLAGLAGVPNMGPGIGASQPQFQRPAVGQWSSQGAMAPPQPFSPLRNEGYGNAAPAVTPAMNQFTAQNQTRGMGGGMTMGRPTRVAATYGGSGGRARFI